MSSPLQAAGSATAHGTGPAGDDAARELLRLAAAALVSGDPPACCAHRLGTALIARTRLDAYACHGAASGADRLELLAAGGVDPDRLAGLGVLPVPATGTACAPLGRPTQVAFAPTITGGGRLLLTLGSHCAGALDGGTLELGSAAADAIAAAFRGAAADAALATAAHREAALRATLAHELRNPLAPIRQAVRLARTETPPDAERLDWSLDVIERHAARMGLLLEELLDGRAAPEEAADPPPVQPPGDAAGERRVVVADDNRDAARSLALLLSLHGFDVRTAHDGREALELVRAFRPASVVLDLGMPELDGYEAAARIRAEPWGGDLVMLAVSGWGSEQDRRRAAEAGFDHHLTKPVDPDRIEALLARAR